MSRFEDRESTDEKGAAELARELDPPERDEPTPAELSLDDGPPLNSPKSAVESIEGLVDKVREQNITVGATNAAELDDRERKLGVAIKALHHYAEHGDGADEDAAIDLADELERVKIDVLFGLTESGLRAMWKHRERELAGDHVPEAECYPRGAEPFGKLAKRLLDDGLLYLINALVLHPVGLALGVNHGSSYDVELAEKAITGVENVQAAPGGISAKVTTTRESWHVVDRRIETEPGVYKPVDFMRFETREQAVEYAHELARADTEPDPLRVAELFIIRTDDPEGFTFEALDHELGLAKLDDAMLKGLDHHLAEYGVRHIERELVKRTRRS